MKKVLTKILQTYADFLISRLENSKNNDEFQSFYLQALYLDFFSNRFNIELK